MGKLFFSILAGYGIFVCLLSLQIITPLIDSIDGQLGADTTMRLVVPGGTPLPNWLVVAIDTHPTLVMRMCEGAVVVLISWSAMLLLTHWARQIRAHLNERRNHRATLASRRLASIARRTRDTWT